MSQSRSSKPQPDPQFQAAVCKLHTLTVWARWLTVIALWLTVGTASLWGLREPIFLLRQYFTWAAVRYGLVYHPISAIGLGLCVGMTLSVLIWQSRNILFGISKSDQKRLETTVLKVRQQGSSHPLWKWLK